MASGSSGVSVAGKSETESCVPLVRCDFASKRRMASSSRPKKSSLSGSSAPGGHRSRMPPRGANSPGSRTVPVREYALRARKRVSSSSSISAPTLAKKLALAMDSRGGTRCTSALIVVTTSAAPLFSVRLASAASVASRLLSISERGDTRS